MGGRFDSQSLRDRARALIKTLRSPKSPPLRVQARSPVVTGACEALKVHWAWSIRLPGGGHWAERVLTPSRRPLLFPPQGPCDNSLPRILCALFVGEKGSSSRADLLVVSQKTSQMHTKLATIFCTAAGLLEIDQRGHGEHDGSFLGGGRSID